MKAEDWGEECGGDRVGKQLTHHTKMQQSSDWGESSHNNKGNQHMRCKIIRRIITGRKSQVFMPEQLLQKIKQEWNYLGQIGQIILKN